MELDEKSGSKNNKNKITNFNLIDLKKRIEYIKKAIYVLDKLLLIQVDEIQNNFYLNFKTNIKEKLSVLEIQYEIRSFILEIIKGRKQINPIGHIEDIHKIVMELNYYIYDLFNLYYKFANKYRMHEIKVLILFEQFKNNKSKYYY